MQSIVTRYEAYVIPLRDKYRLPLTEVFSPDAVCRCFPVILADSVRQQ